MADTCHEDNKPGNGALLIVARGQQRAVREEVPNRDASAIILPQRNGQLAQAIIEGATQMRRAAHLMQLRAAASVAECVRMRQRLRAGSRRSASTGWSETSALNFWDGDFFAASNQDAVLLAAVDAALQLTGADMGNLQLLDSLGTLQIVAQRGFDRPFLEFFSRVHDGEAACGVAMAQAKRVIVQDVKVSPIFVGTSALDVMLEARVCAVQSTPLIGRSGRFLGMLSTHYHEAQRPSERDLRLIDLTGQRAARWIQLKSASGAA
jgi:hypothetical protein